MTTTPAGDLPLILLGAGGHARVLLSTLLETRKRVIGFVHKEQTHEALMGIPCLGGDDAISAHDPGQVLLINGIGSVGSIENRMRVYQSFRKAGYRFASVIHPSAILAPEVQLADDVQIMAGAILQTGSSVRENCIVNTGARIDHDCILEAHVHVAPGAVLSGDVHVGARAHIGAGATVIQGVQIGAGSIVGAGAVVLSDVPDSCTVVGVPARAIGVKAQTR